MTTFNFNNEWDVEWNFSDEWDAEEVDCEDDCSEFMTVHEEDCSE